MQEIEDVKSAATWVRHAEVLLEKEREHAAQEVERMREEVEQLQKYVEKHEKYKEESSRVYNLVFECLSEMQKYKAAEMVGNYIVLGFRTKRRKVEEEEEEEKISRIVVL